MTFADSNETAYDQPEVSFSSGKDTLVMPQDPGGRASISGAVPQNAPSGTLPSVCIVGSKGRMGEMFVRRLSEKGFPVHGFDRAIDEQRHKACEHMEGALRVSRIVLLCVPVTVLRDVLAQVVPLLASGQLLMDITSVKQLPMQWMQFAYQGPVIGAHPLFGPHPSPEDRRVILVNGDRATEADRMDAEKLFSALDCNLFWSGAKEHDEGVAIAQSLNFTVSAAYFCALARHEGIRPFLTPSFKRHLEAARKHLTEDTAMFLEFTAANPAYPDTLACYGDIIAEVLAGNLPRVAEEAAAWYEESSVRE